MKCRGWNGIDTGSNVTFYLWIGSLYRTLSPLTVWYDEHVYVNHIFSDGNVGETWVDKNEGGVLVFIFTLIDTFF